MPNYTYTDDAGHFVAAQHGILDNPIMVCACGLDMWRMPSRIANVSWGGLSPSNAVNRSREITEFIDPNNVAKRRDEFERKRDDRP